MRLISLIFNNGLAQWVFGCVFGVSTLDVIEGTQIYDVSFVESLLNNPEAKVVYVCSTVYLICFVLSRLSNTWKEYQLNKLEVRRARKLLEQEEIEAKIKLKRLSQKENHKVNLKRGKIEKENINGQ